MSPMSEQAIRVGFVGAGANTKLHHIPKLRAQPGVVLVGVANRSKASGEKVAKEFDIPKVFGDWREVIASPDVDAICIGTWPYMHAEMSHRRADRGQARALRGAHGHERRGGPPHARGLAQGADAHRPARARAAHARDRPHHDPAHRGWLRGRRGGGGAPGRAGALGRSGGAAPLAAGPLALRATTSSTWGSGTRPCAAGWATRSASPP